MTECNIIVPLLSECQRFERWEDCIKPLTKIEGRELLLLSKDSLESQLQAHWTFVLPNSSDENLIRFCTENFPQCHFHFLESKNLAQVLYEIVNKMEMPIIITDADAKFEGPMNFNDDSQIDAYLFVHRHSFKSQLGLEIENGQIKSLTAHPDQSTFSSCGSFIIKNKERFLQFLTTARDEDSASELIKSWYHRGARLGPLELSVIYNLISQKHILHYQGRYGEGYRTFKEFYPYYLSEHRETGTKVFHFFGTGIGLILFAIAAIFVKPIFILYGLFVGYLFAWVSHMLIEHNRPATFKYPFFSFASDFVMFFELLTGKRSFSDPNCD